MDGVEVLSLHPIDDKSFFTALNVETITVSEKGDVDDFIKDQALKDLIELLPEERTPRLHTEANVIQCAADYIEALQDQIRREKNVQETEEDDLIPDRGPKRPQNGFIRFSIEERKKISDDHPHMDNRDVTRLLGAKWRKLPEEKKRPYEIAFAKDMESIRTENPGWKYAPVKHLSQELIEPMPSRLRPRSTLRRKQIPALTRKYERKKRRPTATAPISHDVKWVRCDLCGKWRALSMPNGGWLPKAWYCYMNMDHRFASCDAPEELQLSTTPASGAHSLAVPEYHPFTSTEYYAHCMHADASTYVQDNYGYFADNLGYVFMTL